MAAGRKRKGGGRGKASKNAARSSYNDDESEENQFDARGLSCVLERLDLVLGLVHLARFPDSLKSLIQAVAEIPVTALELCGNSSSYGKLISFCSRILREVLKTEHGDQASTAAEVLKSLTPLILLPKSQARTFALGFIRDVMMRAAKEAEGIKKAVVNFPRYLSQKAPEKSEPRALAVESIMDIVRALEFEDQVGFVEYIVKMTQGKAQLRLLAVDLVLYL